MIRELSRLCYDYTLVLADFDDCIAKTLSPSPNGIGVKEAYGLALQQIFGTELVGQDPLAEIGGLQNRAPMEVVTAILGLNGTKDLMMAAAQQFFQEQAHELGNYVPENKGVPLKWNSNPVMVIAEMLVRVKISILLQEIGPAWPRPCPGFLEFYQQLPELKKPCDLIIVSSGHDLFIEKTFKTWGCKQHPTKLTDDDLRYLYQDRPGPTKPDACLIHLALKNWLLAQGIAEPPMLKAFPALARKKAIYIGDDLKKDGGLAQNAGLPFYWFNPNNAQGHVWNDHVIGNWEQLISRLGLA